MAKEPEKITEQLMQELENGIKQTLDSEHFADWCKKQSNLFYNHYSFKNAMLAYVQKPDASYLCGYETWKDYGRQVKKGAKSIKIFAPLYAKDMRGKGSLFQLIKKECKKQLSQNPEKEFANYRLGQSKLSFNMYKNNLWDIKRDNKTLIPHITEDDVKRFIERNVIGKVPTYYKAVSVFDISDTSDKVEELWVNPNKCRKEEMILDENGNAIKDKNGNVKIKNSDERRATFFEKKLDFAILNENNPEKMEVLYETLKSISADKGIPFEEKSPADDETLKNGALGYFMREPSKIVISDELSLTNKVSVAFHEMAHSDLHMDIDWLHQEMNFDAGEKITKQMKEIQAEATSYIAASAFGIETEHKSFDYLASWSNGRELDEFEKSIDVIYKEGTNMLRSIEKELTSRGFDMSLEKIKNEPDLQADKNNVVGEYFNIYVEKSDYNKEYMNELKKELATPKNIVIKGIIEDQLTDINTIDKILNSMNARITDYTNTDNKSLQESIKAELKADVKKMDKLYADLTELAHSKVDVMSEMSKSSENLHDLYEISPMKCFKKLHEMYYEIRNLSNVELKYLASSGYLRKNYSKLLNTDTDKFVKICVERANEFSKAMSKNNTVVEVRISEVWGDKPKIVSGTIAHPKAINKIIAEKEKNIRLLKKEAEKTDDYYPYSKCSLEVYHVEKDGSLSRASTKVDIGDGGQKDLTDHLGQIVNQSALFQDFTKSVRERKEPYIYIPDINNDLELMSSNVVNAEIVAENSTESMDYWRNEIKGNNSSLSIDNSRTEEKTVASKSEERDN